MSPLQHPKSFHPNCLKPKFTSIKFGCTRMLEDFTRYLASVECMKDDSRLMTMYTKFLTSSSWYIRKICAIDRHKFKNMYLCYFLKIQSFVLRWKWKFIEFITDDALLRRWLSWSFFLWNKQQHREKNDTKK